MAKIDLSNISHSYNPNDPKPVYALNPFSMTWENGNRYAILGPSGCGKTTMLNIVSGLVCLLYTSPSPRDKRQSRMPSSA